MSLQKLIVSVSGGRTSMFMAKRLHDEYRQLFDMLFVFANTGVEWEQTLLFIHRFEVEWHIPVIWLEAVTHAGERRGCTHKVVSFETASREGKPFEEMIRKYGIPNKAYPHCTRELKLNPIRSFAESIHWSEYLTAVGIRADEQNRVRVDAVSARIIYPLVDMFPTDKPTINDWWSAQSFDLGLQDYQGNCKWCWKKSDKKLIQIAKETPEAFEFPLQMEAAYGLCGHNLDGTVRTFFRQHRSAVHILKMAELLSPAFTERPDENSGCAESCEAFG